MTLVFADFVVIFLGQYFCTFDNKQAEFKKIEETAKTNSELTPKRNRIMNESMKRNHIEIYKLL